MIYGLETLVAMLEKHFENCNGGVWDPKGSAYYFMNEHGQILGHVKHVSGNNWAFENYKNRLKEDYEAAKG